ncbi:MAG: benzoate-CoA ligase family protein [Actinomycetota bacterium]
MVTIETSVYNATVDLLERNSVRADAPYLVTPRRTWTYGEVIEAANGAGAGLLELGLRRGDRVLLALQDSPEFVITFWGAMKAGLVPVPVAAGLSSADIHFMLSDSEARVAVCDLPSSSAVIPAAAKAGVEVLFVGGVRDGARTWAEVCGRPGSLDAAPTTGHDTALWLYTSGTTGLPKAVIHRHQDLQAAPNALAQQIIELGPDDVVFSVSKMFFAYGLGNSVYLPASAGASVIVHDGPSIPARIAALLDEHEPTVLFGVPAFFAGYANLDEATIPSSVRVVLSAGEAMKQSLFDTFKTRFGLELLDGLGSTEALHHFSCNRAGDVVPGSAGRPLDGYEVKVLDREQEPVTDGSSGELWVKGPTLFAGYWRRPDLTSRAFMGEWMRTGDLVRVVDGRIFHEGRLDDLIKLGGVWVSPSEVEELLATHPDVADVAVVTVDDEVGVPTLKAFVLSERDDKTLIAELRRMCRGKLATFKIPKAFEIVPELPRTPTGKLKRFVLRGGTADGTTDEIRLP